MNGPASANRPVRVDVTFDAVVTGSDGHCLSALVKDFSAGGFRLEVKEELLPGEDIFLQVGKGKPLAAQVQWSLANQACGSFPADVDAKPR